MPVSLAQWPTKEIMQAMREHLDRYRRDPAYRERCDAESKARWERYYRWLAVVEGGGDPYGEEARGP